MRLTSKGLGKIALPFAIDEANITREDGALWFRGRIKEKKVNWDYRMRLDEADIVGFIALARDRAIVDYLARRVRFRLFGALLGQAVRSLLYFVGLRRFGAPRLSGREVRNGVLVQRPRQAQPPDRVRLRDGGPRGGEDRAAR